MKGPMKKINAVVFDYGGVLADVVEPVDGFLKMGAYVHRLVSTFNLSAEEIAEDIEEAGGAYGGWKRLQSRRTAPREMSQYDFWDLVTYDWQEPARNVVLNNATSLTQELELTVMQRRANAGVAEVLRTLRTHGLKLVLASNCLSGAAARAQLAEDKLLPLFDAAMFSDEVGYRKPGPELLQHALAAVQIPAEEACFVGDRFDRDILAGRRAGLALCILRNAPGGPGRQVRGIDADYTIDDLLELLPILQLNADVTSMAMTSEQSQLPSHADNSTA